MLCPLADGGAVIASYSASLGIPTMREAEGSAQPKLPDLDE